jgi:hypothetical protein
MDKIAGTVTYQYQLLRYQHDVATGEFAHVGLVYFDTKTHFLRTCMIKKYERIALFFGDIDGEHLMKTLKGLENELNRLAKSLNNGSAFRQFSSVKELTASVLPTNDNALSFSPIFNGIDFDHNDSFNDLYYNLIGKYNGETLEEQGSLPINGKEIQGLVQKNEARLSPVLV